MSRQDLHPEEVLGALEKGKPEPAYLLHGANEFAMTRIVDTLMHVCVPESARAFNLEIFYGGESQPADVLASARSVPFLAERRLVIVRRTEQFREELLEQFLPYLERPVESTCLVFTTVKADFKKRFFKSLRSMGASVACEELKEDQLVSWIRRKAAELGFKIHPQACFYLQQVVGNNQRDLYAELEKLRVRHGDANVGLKEVKETAIHSRSFTVFELMNRVSARNGPASLAVLNRFLEEEDKRGGPLRVLGMLNRQVRLLWLTRATLDKGGKRRDVAEKLGAARFSADEFISSAKRWSVGDLEGALGLLYQADGFLKTGSPAKLVLENLVLSLCTQGKLG